MHGRLCKLSEEPVELFLTDTLQVSPYVVVISIQGIRHILGKDQMLEIFKLFFLAYDKPKKSRKCVPDILYKIKIEKTVTKNLSKKEN